MDRPDINYSLFDAVWIEPNSRLDKEELEFVYSQTSVCSPSSRIVTIMIKNYHRLDDFLS